MQKFVGTILVIVVCLVSLSTSVQAQTTYEVPGGGIAIIGFNFDDPDQFAFVCLDTIPAGTEIRFTDNGWQSSGSFRLGEGILSWYTPGGCELGQIMTIIPSQHINNTTGDFFFSDSGDQILVYQYISTITKHIFALNSEGTSWQTSANSANTSANPFGTDTTRAIALDEIDNAIYTGPKSFNTTADALAAIVNKANWSGSNDVRQAMPTGSFSFTTTAVHLSEFSAESEEESAPWWIIAGLVVIPVLVMVVRKPKRDCCK